VVLDKLTYAGHKKSLEGFSNDSRFEFLEADIADAAALESLFNRFQPTALVNFAAETHVDRSIDGPAAFVHTNLLGTFHLLERTRLYWQTLDQKNRDQFRFLHVSTDEVYGSLGKTGLFSEETAYAPNSPYAASKAGADHLVRAYRETYQIPVLITNCSNNYGPYQYPEKLIPLMILNAIEGKPLPIYGDGGNVRDWLYVEDHCRGIWEVLTRGRLGEKYNIGSRNEWTNVLLVKKLCQILESVLPSADNPHLRKKKISHYEDLITSVKDRPGHDRRYGIDSTKIEKELNWKPAHNFEAGLQKTVKWYLDNKDWCEAVQSGKYKRERLGLSVG